MHIFVGDGALDVPKSATNHEAIYKPVKRAGKPLSTSKRRFAVSISKFHCFRGVEGAVRTKLGFIGELFVFGDYSSVAYGATFPHKGRLADSKHSATDG